VENAIKVECDLGLYGYFHQWVPPWVFLMNIEMKIFLDKISTFA
jgi:hypothetical protein